MGDNLDGDDDADAGGDEVNDAGKMDADRDRVHDDEEVDGGEMNVWCLPLATRGLMTTSKAK